MTTSRGASGTSASMTASRRTGRITVTRRARAPGGSGRTGTASAAASSAEGSRTDMRTIVAPPRGTRLGRRRGTRRRAPSRARVAPQQAADLVPLVRAEAAREAEVDEHAGAHAAAHAQDLVGEAGPEHAREQVIDEHDHGAHEQRQENGGRE